MAAVLAPDHFEHWSLDLVADHPTVLRAKKIAAYRRRLALAPWFYEHSDDQVEWRAGRDEFKALHELQAEVDPKGLIWREVAPARMACGLAIPQPRVAPRFPCVYCSSCGEGFGPGNEGFSHCIDHAHLQAVES